MTKLWIFQNHETDWIYSSPSLARPKPPNCCQNFTSFCSCPPWFSRALTLKFIYPFLLFCDFYRTFLHTNASISKDFNCKILVLDPIWLSPGDTTGRQREGHRRLSSSPPLVHLLSVKPLLPWKHKPSTSPWFIDIWCREGIPSPSPPEPTPSSEITQVPQPLSHSLKPAGLPSSSDLDICNQSCDSQSPTSLNSSV